MRRLVHLITPGDHFSPRTGSAIPTVVDGLSEATPTGRPRPVVLVSSDTYPDRYSSAEVIDYPLAAAHRSDRWTDAVRGRLGLPRAAVRRRLAPALAAQREWDPAAILLHNLPQGVPLVSERHRAIVYAHNRLWRSYGDRESRRTLSTVGGIICVSDFLAGETAADLPEEFTDRIRVVPNGVDEARFGGPVVPRGDRLQVLYVGRLTQYKGPDLLLDAVDRLDRSDIDVTIIGSYGFSADGPLTAYEEQVRRAAGALRRPAVVRPAVDRSAVAAAMKQADVIVVPSRWPEPFGLTALEGMAAGAAVVAAEIGGLTETVRDVGVLFPPDEIDALAERIASLADDEGALTRVQARCRAHASNRSWADTHRRLDEAMAALAAG